MKQQVAYCQEQIKKCSILCKNCKVQQKMPFNRDMEFTPTQKRRKRNNRERKTEYNDLLPKKGNLMNETVNYKVGSYTRSLLLRVIFAASQSTTVWTAIRTIMILCHSAICLKTQIIGVNAKTKMNVVTAIPELIQIASNLAYEEYQKEKYVKKAKYGG